MIGGVVTAAGEATVRLAILRPDGSWEPVAAVSDAGFTGYLTLPPSVIVALHLPTLGQGTATLGDGSIGRFDYYQATILWDGARWHIRIAAAATQPLIGMDLLHGHRPTIDVVAGGRTIIAALPMPR